MNNNDPITANVLPTDGMDLVALTVYLKGRFAKEDLRLESPSRRMYALYDKRAEEYGNPVVYPNDTVAFRAFVDLLGSNEHNAVCMHPSDFCLVYLGDFLIGNAFMLQDGAEFRVICDGAEYVKKSVTNKE